MFRLPVARVPLFALFSRYLPFEGSTYRATLNGENLGQRATLIILIFVFRGSTCNTVPDVAGRLRGRRQKSTVLFCRPFRRLFTLCTIPEEEKALVVEGARNLCTIAFSLRSADTLVSGTSVHMLVS